MKKKIRDLTIEECKKFCGGGIYANCPFEYILCNTNSYNCLLHQVNADLFLDQEVEVEDDK